MTAPKDDAFTTLYRELRPLVSAYLRHERTGHSFWTSDLLHEVYLRLPDTAVDEARLRALLPAVIRHVLVDRARHRDAKKRGGDWTRIPLEIAVQDASMAEETSEFPVLDVHESLLRLREFNEQHAQILELRIFGRMTLPEISEVMEIPRRTLDQEWRYARAWLRHALTAD